MKNISKFIVLAATMALASSCYEPYVKDYDYNTAFCAFQYDLRTFVLGEGEKFDFTVALAGLVNDRDRKVKVQVNDELVTGDIPTVLGLDDAGSFTAYQGLIGKAAFGTLSQPYVSDEVGALDIKEMTPLPSDLYTVAGLDNMVIKAGRNTATATVKATEAFAADPKAIAPYYAIAFQITSADADKIPADKAFEVIAVKFENKYFGNWYYGGKTTVVDDATGEIISEDSYPLVLPQKDDQVYSLKTVDANAVVTDKIGNKNGQLKLVFDGEDISLSCESRAIQTGLCYANGAKLLQDRKIYLNYSYSNEDGTTSFVTDVLTFRNRIRDGINEWQDENEENYK